ncbi:MAG: chemotaxis protein CheA, partial [Rhizobacter sp.]|nr:chemotaxis protein CheA [Rhizobacter sp.]
MNLDQALQTFIAECRELLEGMESDLLAIGQAPLDNEVVNSIFRAAHTIKGSAGLFGLDHIVAFTHVVESVLDAVRDGALDIDEDLRSLLLACRDHIGTLVEAVANGETDPDAALIERGTPLTEQLWKRLEQVRPGSKPATAPAATHAGIDPTAASFQRITSGGSGADNWHISLRFGQGVLRNGMDPLSFLRYLKTLGRIVALVTVPDALPQPNDMDPECCYLGFEIAFASNADKAQIESVFEFVLDDCAVRILPPNSRITEYIELIHHLPEEPSMVGQILVQCGTLTAHELVAALAAQDHAAGGTPLGEILVEQGAVQAPVIEAALSKQKQVKEAQQQETQSGRVDADKLDSL